MADVARMASLPDWPGYVGAPRFATAAQGARDYAATMTLIREYAFKILDGFDYRKETRYSDSPITGGPPAGIPGYENESEQRQQQWLRAHARK